VGGEGRMHNCGYNNDRFKQIKEWTPQIKARINYVASILMLDISHQEKQP
jgi:hypothetical protein